MIWQCSPSLDDGLYTIRSLYYTKPHQTEAAEDPGVSFFPLWCRNLDNKAEDQRRTNNYQMWA